MKFFIDSANLAEIREANDLGVLDGVTTNPSLVAKEGKEFIPLLMEILAIVDGPVSAEVISTDFAGMMKEAHDLAKLHKNIVIKVPMTLEGLKAISELHQRGVETNATLVFSPNQALLAAKAGATFVSPFVGRLDDIGQDGMQVIQDIMTMFRNYDLSTQVLAASIRHTNHFFQAAILGADAATIPLSVLLNLIKHPLTDIGLEQFLKDWAKH